MKKNNKEYWKGKLGVIISSRGDKGFYTRGASEECITDYSLGALIYHKKFNEAKKYILEHYPGTTTENLEDLEIIWIRLGSEFTIIEVEGRERVLYKSRIKWLTSE